MALRKIVTVGDPILTKVCRPVTRFDQKLAILIEDMIETMHNANGVGLAGPQVGVMRRLCVVDTGEEDVELVNPEVVEHRTGTATGTNMRATISSPAASCTRSTILTAICTPRSPNGCSRRRSWRR